MTSTPEMIAMAERIADSKCRVRESSIWIVAYDAALTAIMETSEKAAIFAQGNAADDGFPYDRAKIHIARAIRNGEHLR